VEQGISPLPQWISHFVLFSEPGHVIEDSVPDDQQAGDDHIRQDSGAEEDQGYLHFGFHHDHPVYARAGTVSAQVSTFARIALSE
jgi:hypothetical protein